MCISKVDSRSLSTPVPCYGVYSESRADCGEKGAGYGLAALWTWPLRNPSRRYLKGFHTSYASVQLLRGWVSAANTIEVDPFGVGHDSDLPVAGEWAEETPQLWRVSRLKFCAATILQQPHLEHSTTLPPGCPSHGAPLRTGTSETCPTLIAIVVTALASPSQGRRTSKSCVDGAFGVCTALSTDFVAQNPGCHGGVE